MTSFVSPRDAALARSIFTDDTYYRWRQEYNTIRPHSSLGYRPPAPETIRLKQAVGLT